MAAIYGAIPVTDTKLLATAALLRNQWADPASQYFYPINGAGRSGWPQRTLPATQASALGSAASRQGHVQRRDVTNAGRLCPELRPLPFGDHLDGAVDDLDGRLFVDGVGRDADFGGPPLCVSQGVCRESV